MKKIICACLLACGLAAAAKDAEGPVVTAVGAINWDCSLPSSTFFGGYQTRSLSPAKYRYMTPYYADVLGPDKIDYHWRTQAEYDREMQYAIDAGIDYFAYCWYADDFNAERVPVSTGRGACVDRHVCELVYARNMHLKSALRSKLKLCAILCGNHPYTDREVETLVRAMKEDCYQKAMGRPLLYLFGNRGDLLARVRRTCRRLGVESPYAVAMYGGRNHPRTGDAGIDALSDYPPVGDGYAVYSELMDAELARNSAKCRDGWSVIPHFTTGKDHSPRIDSPVPWCDNPPRRYPRAASGEEIVEGARRLRDWIVANRRSCPTGHILTFAWNEFEEGGWICPTWTPNGPDTTRVKAFAEASRLLKSPVPEKPGMVGEDARFALSLKQKPGGKARLVRFAEADDVARKNLPNGDEEFLFTYRDPAAPVRAARVALRRDADGAVRHKLSCEMNPGWFLERTMFPVIEMPCEEATSLVFGSNKGGVFHDPSKWPVGRWQGCASPGSCCAPFAAAWNDEAGRYIGIEDAKGYMKSFGFSRTEKGVRFVLHELVWTTGSYTQDYWVVTRRVARGAEPLRWYDFADIYKEWDRRQAWSRTSFLARADIPAWMKDAPAFTRFSRQWLGRPDAIRKFVDWWRRDVGDKPVVAALWGWEKVGTWWGPDYFPCHPSDEVFTATMKELRGRDFHPFAWPSGYNWSKVIGDKGDGTYEWDGRERFIKPVESHLVVNEDGTLCHIPAFWLRNGALTTICGGDRWTHDWWNNLTKDLARRHCDIVQVDQVVGGRIRTCWSPQHGHPVGNGLWMWQTFRRQLEEMHAAMRSVEPNGLVGVEEPNMMYNDLVGIQDYRDLESPAPEFASVCSYLYHGYVPMFQSNPFRDEFFSLAHAATDGQMPFYKPDFAELEPSRPAIRNGGFENLVDSVRGPAGWDRLIPSRMLQGVNADKPLWNFAGCNNMGWLGYAVTLEYGDRHGGDVSLLFDVPAKGGRDNGKPVQVSQTVGNLEPGEYTVSAWVKTLDGAPSGRDALPRVRTGSLKYGTRAGEQGEIPFPASGGWTKVSAMLRSAGELRLIVWAPPGAKFLIDDVRLERNGQEVVVSGDSPYTRFMKKWIALYQGEGKAFLANGFQVKPPALACDTFRFAAREEKAVCFAAYESASGERALALANATDKPQRVTGEWKGRTLDITLPPHDLQLVK